MSSLDAILTRERQYQREFFGQEFDLSSLQKLLERCGPEVVARWSELGLEPHFLPQVTMSSGEDFPGWKIKLDGGDNWYYEQVDEQRIVLCQANGDLTPETLVLNGITVLIDTRMKPEFNGGKQMFENDNLFNSVMRELREREKIASFTQGNPPSRFGTSSIEWEEYIRPSLAKHIGLEVSQIRLERAVEANVISQLYPYMPRALDGGTNTWLWCEEYFIDSSRRLLGGGLSGGGLSAVRARGSDSRWEGRGLRALAVLGE